VRAQAANAAITRTVAGDRGVEADMGLVEPEAVLAEFEDWPAQPGRPDQPGRGDRLAVQHVAEVVCQPVGCEMAADQQVVARGGGVQARPGIPALPLGARPSGPPSGGCPSLERAGALRAGHGRPAVGQR
jgi:hypothetical protein